ncbi:MAG: hypothetical protein RRA92_11260 [Gemmatimonadota bacterium]|nr:hypothetical protein [Gemmatimonadota bacterium]
MSRVLRVLPLVLSLSLLAACGGDDDPVAPPAATLVGTWNATAVELVSVARPATRADLVQQGATATLILAQGGSFTFDLAWPGGEPGGVWGTELALAGTWTSTDVLTLQTSPTSEWQFEAVLTGDVLVLSEADTEYDFDGNGSLEACDLGMRLARQ